MSLALGNIAEPKTGRNAATILAGWKELMVDSHICHTYTSYTHADIDYKIIQLFIHTCIHAHTHIYIYIHTIFIYIYICVCMYIYITLDGV